jgi:hypothetical protein
LDSLSRLSIGYSQIPHNHRAIDVNIRLSNPLASGIISSKIQYYRGWRSKVEQNERGVKVVVEKTKD